MAYGKIADQKIALWDFRHNVHSQKYIACCRHFDCVVNCSVSGLHSEIGWRDTDERLAPAIAIIIGALLVVGDDRGFPAGGPQRRSLSPAAVDHGFALRSSLPLDGYARWHPGAISMAVLTARVPKGRRWI